MMKFSLWASLLAVSGALRLGGPRVMMVMSSKASFAIVGCGSPGKGMGWFHGLQLTSGACSSAQLTDVVEPYLLGPGKETPAGVEFKKEIADVWDTVSFATSMDSLWTGADGPKIALIASRTNDNPRLFKDALEAGATHVLLEKPGAPSVEELEAMAADAAKRKVPVAMGFIKQLSGYFIEAVAVSKKNEGSVVSLVSLNDYTEDNLGECFMRNSEGLLKNMAIHELALAASHFGMSPESIVSVDCDTSKSELRTIGDFTDFSKVDFVITNDKGLKLRMVADRCGGDGSFAQVHSGEKLLLETKMVDAKRAAAVAKRQAEHPDWISYLLTQEFEYAQLKEAFAAAALKGTAEPVGIATIDVAIKALKLADFLTPRLEEALK